VSVATVSSSLAQALPQLARIPGCSYFGLSIAKENREVLLLQQFEYKARFMSGSSLWLGVGVSAAAWM